MILVIFLIVIILVLTYLYFTKNNTKKPIANNEYIFDGILKKYIFTYHEKMFFEQLKKITDDNNCYIFPKMRIADVITSSDFKNFSKISSKHIDYTICNKSCSPILFIELDDYTHNYESSHKRDEKKDIIFEKANAKLLRINSKNKEEILNYIKDYLKEYQNN